MRVARVTCCLVALLLSFASGAEAASDTTFVGRSQGPGASATFDSFSSDGCVETFVEIAGFQNSNTHRLHAAFINIIQDDSCAGTISQAVGSESEIDLQVSATLSTASLITTITLVDLDSGNTFPVAVNLTWTSTSALQHENTTLNIHTRCCSENFHANAIFRDATASGAITSGTTNFSPSPSIAAQIMNGNSVDVSITHS